MFMTVTSHTLRKPTVLCIIKMEVSRADDSAQNVCLVHRRPELNLQNHNKKNSVQNMADLYRKYVMMSVPCTKIHSWELLTDKIREEQTSSYHIK